MYKKKGTLEDLGEFGFINRLYQAFETKNANIIQGIGDDCAVIARPEENHLLWSIDTLLEGIHFRLDYTDFYHLGWKSLAANLSDIAAMGGLPTHALLSLALRENIDISDLDRFYKGFYDLADKYSVTLAGGDLVRSPSDLMITVAISGIAQKGNHILYRNAAQPGDWIVTTGFLGDAAAGLSILQTGVQDNGFCASESITKPLIQAHLQPNPDIMEGTFLASFPQVHAAIDLSDGLAQDLRHICQLSRVGALIEQRKIPLSKEITTFAASRKISALDWALFGGEDYHLLATIEAPAFEDINAAFYGEFQKRLYPIGEITQKKKILLMSDKGKPTPLDPLGYDHFK